MSWLSGHKTPDWWSNQAPSMPLRELLKTRPLSQQSATSVGQSSLRLPLFALFSAPLCFAAFFPPLASPVPSTTLSFAVNGSPSSLPSALRPCLRRRVLAGGRGPSASCRAPSADSRCRCGSRRGCAPAVRPRCRPPCARRGRRPPPPGPWLPCPPPARAQSSNAGWRDQDGRREAWAGEKGRPNEAMCARNAALQVTDT